MRNKILPALLLFSIFLLLSFKFAKAQDKFECSDRYLTLVNPVRGRSLWVDKSLTPLLSQYSEISKYGFPATWLLQYDALGDTELTGRILGFDKNQEIGLFLEVSRGLAGDSGVAFPIYVRWSDPGAIFLSAYSQSERRKLIDKMFNLFESRYGSYPKSVGAWWIDSYSLNYMVKKYKISAALIVADQKVTDSYGVWGQWWGFPYRPSKANILVPASSLENGQDVVVIQWAQRDPVLAYGGAGNYSGFSLQANDYILHAGRDHAYFRNLVSKYLDCQNRLAQITIGLETGQESLSQPEEYRRQLKYLSEIRNLIALTMSDFAAVYTDVNGVNAPKITFGDKGSNWEMTTTYRKNEKLGENTIYDQSVSFSDYFIRDSSGFLERWLPLNVKNKAYFPVYLIVALLFLAVSVKLKLFGVWAVASLTLLASLGLLFRSNFRYGWEVFYGPEVDNLILVQVAAVAIVYTAFIFFDKYLKDKLSYWIFLLTFGIDRIISVFRYTSISGERYFGITLGVRDFYGAKLTQQMIVFVRKVFEPIQFQSLVRFDFSKVWQNHVLYFFVYPAVHILLAFLIWKLIREKSYKVKAFVFFVLSALLVWQIIYIFNVDPLSVRGIDR